MQSSADVQSSYTFRKQQFLKNRTVMAPMTNMASNEDGSLNDRELRWLARRAEGGFGMIVTCASHVRKDAKAWHGQLGIFDDSLIPGLSEIPRELHRYGSLAIAQLFHGGVRSTSKTTGKQPVAPSVVHQDFKDFELPRALEETEILEIIEDFKNAALRAQRAGFDGVEIHGANGYLFTQFISRVTNLRSDQWGGELKNRARFLFRVLAEIRQACPAPFILGLRLLPEDTPKARGFDIDETCELLEHLENYGVDYVHLSGKDVHANPWKYADGSRTILKRFRDALSPTIALIAAGGIKTEADTQAAFRDGADLVAVATAAITEPDWPKKIADASFKPKAVPLSSEEASARAISKPFVDYLKTMKIVKD